MKGLKIQTLDGIVLAQGKREFFGNRLNTCSYWLDGIIIDTGPHSLAQDYQAFYQERPIVKAILTHHHEDHTGNAAYLAREGIPVFAHHQAIENLAKPAPVPFYRRLYWRPRPPVTAKALPPIVETQGGKKIKVLEAPGHTVDHVALLYEDRGILFTGDLFVSPYTKLGARGENYPQWMESISRLLEYDFDILGCSHSGFVKGGKKLLARKLENLRELEDKVQELGKEGMTVAEIESKLLPGGGPIKLFSGGEWGPTHVIRSLLEDGEGIKG